MGPARGGNAYLILARQYIAAELNMLNGASMPDEVAAAFLEAAELLDFYDGSMTIDKSDPNRAVAIELSRILDEYNMGLTEPGSCTDNNG